MLGLSRTNSPNQQHKFFFKKNFMAPFYGWSSTASSLEPPRGVSLPFTTKFREIPGTHFIDLGLGIQRLNH